MGRAVNLHTLGGDVHVGALFADQVTVDTAGGAIAVKMAQVSGVGALRSHGGRIAVAAGAYTRPLFSSTSALSVGYTRPLFGLT